MLLGMVEVDDRVRVFKMAVSHPQIAYDKDQDPHYFNVAGRPGFSSS